MAEGNFSSHIRSLAVRIIRLDAGPVFPVMVVKVVYRKVSRKVVISALLEMPPFRKNDRSSQYWCSAVTLFPIPSSCDCSSVPSTTEA